MKGSTVLLAAVLALTAGCATASAPPAATAPVATTAANTERPPPAASGHLDMDPPHGSDGVRLEEAVVAMDAGRRDEAIAALEDLRRAHPDNAIILHELGLAYRLTSHPEKALALWMPIRAELPVITLAAVGSALDESGRKTEAIAFLREEIARHPTSGLLHSELGTSLFNAGKADESLQSYERGASVEPRQPANHLHLAELYAKSDRRALCLLHGETFRVLEPKSERSRQIGALMVKVYGESVRIEKRGAASSARVSLAPAIPIGGTMPLANAFELTFGGHLVLALAKGISLASLHEARKGFFDKLDDKGPPALLADPLIRWVRALAAAGHLAAYDYWLYGPAYPDEFEQWAGGHEGEVRAMVEYLLSHPLFPAKT